MNEFYLLKIIYFDRACVEFENPAAVVVSKVDVAAVEKTRAEPFVAR